MFSSRSFIFSGLMFKLLIHFELIFVYSVRYGFNFILFQLNIQFSHYYLLKRLSFPPCYSLSTLVGDHLTKWALVYVWALYAVSLVYMSVFMPMSHSFDYCSFVINFVIRRQEASSFLVLSQDCYGYLGSFVAPFSVSLLIFSFCSCIFFLSLLSIFMMVILNSLSEVSYTSGFFLGSVPEDLFCSFAQVKFLYFMCLASLCWDLHI